MYVTVLTGREHGLQLLRVVGVQEGLGLLRRRRPRDARLPCGRHRRPDAAAAATLGLQLVPRSLDVSAGRVGEEVGKLGGGWQRLPPDPEHGLDLIADHFLPGFLGPANKKQKETYGQIQSYSQ